MLRDVAGVTDELLDALESAGVQDAEDLRWAVSTQQVLALREDAGLRRRIRRALRMWAPLFGMRPLADARETAARVLNHLQRDDNALRLAVSGDVRRMEPEVSHVQLLATAHDADALFATFRTMPFVREPELPDMDRWSVLLDDGMRVRLHVVPEDPNSYFLRWVESTGPEEHVAALRAHAKKQGFTWTRDGGLLRDGSAVPISWEDDVYVTLGLAPTPPEIRGATLHTSPPDLVTPQALRGAMHVHTNAGAGTASLEVMAAKASREGYAWLFITDRGLDTDAREAQRVAARNWNLKRREAAAAEGEGEGEPVPAQIVLGQVAVLERGQDPAQGLLGAVCDARIRVLGHPDAGSVGTWGRKLSDWVPILDACATQGVAVEVSGQHRRLRLPKGWHRAAQARGLKLVIGADAHEPDDLDMALSALGQARRGGWAPGEVLNTLEASAFQTWLGD